MCVNEPEIDLKDGSNLIIEADTSPKNGSMLINSNLD